MEMISRRSFAAKLPLALAAGELLGRADGQTASGQTAGHAELKELSSGVFKAGPPHGTDRVGRQFLVGMLKAGNIRLEMHETAQIPGAVHEPDGTHLHNEIWCVQHGTASLYINGTEHTMEAGDVGLVCAGDHHWIKNIGDGELSYFVITVGPPE